MKNRSFDNGISRECFVSQRPEHFEVTEFVEELTWNKCLKLRLAQLLDNEVKVSAVILFGHLEKQIGFAAEPETTYEFSFEAKGTVPAVVVSGFLYHNDDPWWKSNTRVKSSLTGAKITPEWTCYKGFFELGQHHQAALGIHMAILRLLVTRNNWQPWARVLVDNVQSESVEPSLITDRRRG